MHKHLQNETYIYNTWQVEGWWMVITVIFTKIIFSTKIKILSNKNMGFMMVYIFKQLREALESAAQITMIFNAIVLN